MRYPISGTTNKKKLNEEIKLDEPKLVRISYSIL